MQKWVVCTGVKCNDSKIIVQQILVQGSPQTEVGFMIMGGSNQNLLCKAAAPPVTGWTEVGCGQRRVRKNVKGAQVDWKENPREVILLLSATKNPKRKQENLSHWRCGILRELRKHHSLAKHVWRICLIGIGISKGTQEKPFSSQVQLKFQGNPRESVKLELWNTKGTQEKQFSYQVWLNIPRESKRISPIREMEC